MLARWREERIDSKWMRIILFSFVSQTYITTQAVILRVLSMNHHRTYRRSHPGGTIFANFRRKLPHISGHRHLDGSNEQYQSIRNFEESLTLQLESLKSGDEGMLRLEWLERALTVALQKHKEAESLIPDLQLPLSECDEKWMNEYLDDTTKILDMCNVLTAMMTALEHSQILLRYSLHTLEKHDMCLRESDVERARKSLCDWFKAVELGNENSPLRIKKERCGALLRSMIDGLKPPKEKAVTKDKGFLYALYGAKAIAILVCSVLALAFSWEDDILAIKLHLSNQFLWSTSIINLLQHAKEEASDRISRGSVTCLLELDNVDNSIRKLLTILDVILREKFPLAEELADQLACSVRDVKRHVNILTKGLDEVGKKINEFFHTVVQSRSVLLDHLGGSGKAVFM